MLHVSVCLFRDLLWQKFSLQACEYGLDTTETLPHPSAEQCKETGRSGCQNVNQLLGLRPMQCTPDMSNIPEDKTVPQPSSDIPSVML